MMSHRGRSKALSLRRRGSLMTTIERPGQTRGTVPTFIQQGAGIAQVNIDNVSKVLKTKPTQTMILDSLSFAVPKGSLFAINGPSGSGKSTLLNILTGIDRPTDGRVLFDGRLLQEM